MVDFFFLLINKVLDLLSVHVYPSTIDSSGGISTNCISLHVWWYCLSWYYPIWRKHKLICLFYLQLLLQWKCKTKISWIMLINISTTNVLILRKLVALQYLLQSWISQKWFFLVSIINILAFLAYWFLYSFDIQFRDIYLLIWSICKKGHAFVAISQSS